MKTLYLECNAGASGDMILGSLTDLLKDPFEFKQMIECAGIPGITAEVTVDDQSSVAGIRVHIMVDGIEEGSKEESGHHDHHALKDVISIIGGLNVSDMVKSDAAQIYRIIAEAESNVHGKPVNEVHFHEVGALDAIADIVGVCMLIEKLAPEQIIASPLRTGFGTVSCAHGILPVPAPATAETAALPVGQLETNCYLLCDGERKVCAAIDPGADADPVAVYNAYCQMAEGAEKDAYLAANAQAFSDGYEKANSK